MKTRVYVSVIIQNQDDQYLILKRSPNARFAPNQWEFVNGSIEEGEAAEEAAIREVYEETGIRVQGKDLRAWPIHELHDEDGRWVVIPFYVCMDISDIKLSDEHTEHRWLNKGMLLDMPYVGNDFGKLLELLS